MGAAVQGTEASNQSSKVEPTNKKKCAGLTANTRLDADVVLVSTGRKPFHDGLG